MHIAILKRYINSQPISGTRTKFKVWGAHVQREAPEIFCRCRPLFWLYKYN